MASWPQQGADPAATGDRQYEDKQLVSVCRAHYEHDETGRITVRHKACLSRKPDVWRFLNTGRHPGASTAVLDLQ